MAKSKAPYEYKRVPSLKNVEVLLRKNQGWELVESSGKENWVMGSDYKALMRRPNPNYRAPEAPLPVADVQSPTPSPAPVIRAAAPTGAKKPWYRRWWAWLIGVVVLLGIIGALVNPKSASALVGAPDAPTVQTVAVFPLSDIPAGA